MEKIKLAIKYLYMGTLHLTGLFTHRRRSASGSVRLGRFTPTPHSTKVLQPANLTICLIGLQNLRKQPERYVQYAPKLVGKLCKVASPLILAKKRLKKNILHSRINVLFI
jgi:hypothetical protein